MYIYNLSSTAEYLAAFVKVAEVNVTWMKKAHLEVMIVYNASIGVGRL